MSDLTIGLIIVGAFLAYVAGVCLIWTVMDKLEDEKLLHIDESDEGKWVVGSLAWPLTIIVLPFIWIFAIVCNKLADILVWILKELKNPKENV